MSDTDSPEPEGTFNNLTLPDHTQAWIKAALNALPFAGGSLASLMESYIPTEAQRTQTLLLRYLAERLEEIDARTTPPTSQEKESEFYDLFQSARLIAAHSKREDKLKAAANLVADHFLADSDPGATTFEEKDYLMKCLDDLSSGALAVLKFAHAISPKTDTPSMAPTDAVHMSQLYTATVQFDKMLVLSLVAELRAKNLVHVQEAAIGSQDRKSDIVLVTPPGRRLVERFLPVT